MSTEEKQKLEEQNRATRQNESELQEPEEVLEVAEEKEAVDEQEIEIAIAELSDATAAKVAEEIQEANASVEGTVSESKLEEKSEEKLEEKLEEKSEVKSEVKPEVIPEVKQEPRVEAAEALQAHAVDGLQADITDPLQTSAVDALQPNVTESPQSNAADASQTTAKSEPQEAAEVTATTLKAESANEDGKAANPSAKERPARAPRAAKKEEEAPQEPSPKQPLLDQLLEELKRDISSEAVETSTINVKNGHLITLTVHRDHWLHTAQWLKGHPSWQCNYLRNISGVDQEGYLEVVYHLIGLSTKQEVAIHVKADREEAVLPSVTLIWETANWNEREVYDLLGITFTGHPNLTRIMMPDQWVGHPLRKDYEPLDSEV